jgi:hypothetical protein
VYKWSINPFTNPNPVYSHTDARDIIAVIIIIIISSSIEIIQIVLFLYFIFVLGLFSFVMITL